LGDRITTWAPFNMPWTFTYYGYGIGVFPPDKANFDQFLKAAHTVNPAQGEAFRAIKAASSKATVGSAYGMAPAYPKTDSEVDRATTARSHAMNNIYFLHTAMHGQYPKAFVGETPYEATGFKPGGIPAKGNLRLSWRSSVLHHPPYTSSSDERMYGGGHSARSEEQELGKMREKRQQT